MSWLSKLSPLGKLIPSARILLVSLVAAGSAYGYGMSQGKKIERGNQADRETLVRSVRDAALTSAAKAISGIKIENRTIRQELEREIRTVVDYSQCVHSPGGLRSINAAISRAEPSGDSELPVADTDD